LPEVGSAPKPDSRSHSAMLSESGWQLSHGERSGLLIAKALLEGTRLLVADEGLASLDPEGPGGFAHRPR